MVNSAISKMNILLATQTTDSKEVQKQDSKASEFKRIFQTAKDSSTDSTETDGNAVIRKQLLQKLAEKTQSSQEDSTVISSETSDTKTVSGSADSTDTDDLQMANENMMAAFQSLILQIEDVLKEKFGLSDEQLNTMMEDSGINSCDLLSGNVLSEFVAKLNGNEDMIQALTDPTFTETMKQIFLQVNQLTTDFMNQFQLTPEDLQNLIQEAEQQLTDTQPIETVQPVDTTTENDTGTVVTTEKSTDISQNVGTSEQLSQSNTTQTVVKEHQDTGSGTSDNSDSRQQSETTTTDTENSTADLTNILLNKMSETILTDTDHTEVNSVVRQIVDGAKILMTEDTTSMQLQLNPEHLGKIILQISSKDGVITAQLAAQNEMAKEAIESQLSLLKENLNNQGIKVDAIEVTIESHPFEQNLNQNDSNDQSDQKKKKKFNADSGESDVTSEISMQGIIEKQIMDQNGTTVNYTA